METKTKIERIKDVAKKLEQEKIVEAPHWSLFVKTSAGKERLPYDANWWYIRAASILFKIDKYRVIGTNKLKKHYSTNKNRGVKPGKTYLGSGKVIRTILQQLEAKSLIKKTQVGNVKGRELTKQGKEFIKV